MRNQLSQKADHRIRRKCPQNLVALIQLRISKANAVSILQKSIHRLGKQSSLRSVQTTQICSVVIRPKLLIEPGIQQIDGGHTCGDLAIKAIVFLGIKLRIDVDLRSLLTFQGNLLHVVILDLLHLFL